MTKITYKVASEHPFPADATAAAASLAGYEALDDITKARVDQMVDWIMKNCLWQFHSRTWDRKRQNEGILGIAAKLLAGEPFVPQTPEDRCYWVDSLTLQRAYQATCPWLATMSRDDILALMKQLHARIDYLTVTGSLNEELTDLQY